MSDDKRADTARRALALLDLTSLGDDDDVAKVEALCARATGAAGYTAAVCIWSRFIPAARAALTGSGVRIATVVNFPEGGDNIDVVAAETRAALADGADEIDLVLPYRAFLAGDIAIGERMVRECKAICRERDARLKVILETGQLATPVAIAGASRAAIRGGADFIKTSTGKTKPAATLEAAEVMLMVINDARNGSVMADATAVNVGFKAAGGIGSTEDAGLYMALADRIMGDDWVSPETFRFGASGVLDDLLAAIGGAKSDGDGEGY